MKKIHLLLISALLITACQQAPKPDAAASSPTPNYPYKIKHPDNWDIDTSHNNTMVALNALKSYETMDTALMKKCFADSITLNLDSFTFKGTNAQFIKMAMTMGASMKNYKIDMKDWEAVVSKDKTEEWVTVWYTQHWANATGKTDSVQYVDDVKLKGGKIIKIDEYGRHFPKK
jgi:PBP1b-binding outer membrane lipoprotein LpoB